MLRTIGKYLVILFFSVNGNTQINTDIISHDQLYIWSSDQFYWFEFYISTENLEQAFEIRAYAQKETTLIKIGIENESFETEKAKKTLCRGEKALVRAFFKTISSQGSRDTVNIEITSDSSMKTLKFVFEMVEEVDQKTKLFQPNFSNLLILDIDYGSIKEIILYTEDRQQFEHIKSRTRILDLSFLQIGTYILEINNEEYIINKM
ncbi:MAG: hypothetical protein R2799_01035 [Crocinitomicaceae bacterium]